MDSELSYEDEQMSSTIVLAYIILDVAAAARLRKCHVATDPSYEY